MNRRNIFHGIQIRIVEDRERKIFPAGPSNFGDHWVSYPCRFTARLQLQIRRF